MGTEQFLKLCKESVADYFNSHVDKSPVNVPHEGKAVYMTICPDDVFVVWCCKTLQNNKALLSTTIPDGMYYELTYNGDKKQLYLDAYKKWENQCICL